MPPFSPSPSAESPASSFNPPACLACGSCCFSTAEHYVPVTGTDYSRLGPDAESWLKWKNNRAFMRMSDGHCAALKMASGPAGRQFICTLYDHRPQTCRDLARGSAQCEADWEAKAELAQSSG